MKKRKTYSPECKAKAVLELLRGEHTHVEIARKLGCHPNLIVLWQQKFIENAAALFENETSGKEHEDKVAELERTIGKLTVQCEFLKKVSGRID